MKIAVIGGGAAGFFAAISAKDNHPNAHVSILEKSNKLLAKVKISGGGRCNVTNGTKSIAELCKAYPRGGKQLKKLFGQFYTVDTIQWFEDRGVPLMIQDDNCVFPVSQDSQSIIDCLQRQTKKHNIKIELGKGVKSITPSDIGLQLGYIKSDQKPEIYDKIIVATGGSPKRSGFKWLEDLGQSIVDPVPSLFTFNMPKEPITKLMGIVVKDAIVSVQGTKLKASGPLLITHWGMSGPAILKLSAFGARTLSELGYECVAQVNWVAELNQDKVKSALHAIIDLHPKKSLSNYRPYALSDRLWQYLITKSELPKDKKWGELGKKGVNKLITILSNDNYQVRGKTTFKEEFVTCGGVDLSGVNMKTLQSNVIPNIYFAGEVLDIDGITGGYNFQAAWTTAYIAGRLG